MKFFKTFLWWGIFLIFCSSVWADIPKQINFQGILKDSLGAPYPDGNYSITFRIYDAASGGNILWQEGQLIAISGGLFTHILGSAISIPDSVFKNSLRWLGIQVAGNPEITPRTQLNSAPYSFQALRSDSAGVATLSLDLTCNGCVDANDLADNSVGTSEIVASQVQRRVTGTAPAGEYITAINQDGSVVTAVDQAGAASGWTDDGTAVRLTTATDLVGIGTSTPLGLLHLKGNNYKFLLESSGNADVVLGRADATRYGNYILADGDPSLSVNNRWAIGLRNGDSKLHLYSEVNSSNVMVLETGGNVGIGTTSPSTPLQVAGQISTNSGSAAAPSFTFAGDLNLGIYRPTTDVIGIATNGVEQMRINSGGDVAIGTTAPSSKLHVREDLDGNQVLTIDNQSTGTSSAQGIYFNSEDGTGTNGAFILAFDNSHGTAPATLRIGNNVSGGKIDFNTGLQTRLTLTNAGDVGIGTASPVAKLHVNGTAGNNTGVWSNLSDLRLKRDIEPIEGALETVEQLQGVSFRWKDAEKDTQFGRVRGLIAQDVEKVIPEWIKTDPDGYKRLEPIGVDALLIEAIKEQQKQIEELKAEVLKLKKGSPQAQAEN